MNLVDRRMNARINHENIHIIGDNSTLPIKQRVQVRFGKLSISKFERKIKTQTAKVHLKKS